MKVGDGERQRHDHLSPPSPSLAWPPHYYVPNITLLLNATWSCRIDTFQPTTHHDAPLISSRLFPQTLSSLIPTRARARPRSTQASPSKGTTGRTTASPSANHSRRERTPPPRRDCHREEQHPSASRRPSPLQLRRPTPVTCQRFLPRDAVNEVRPRRLDPRRAPLCS